MNATLLSPSLLPKLEDRIESFLLKKRGDGIAFNVEMSRYHLATGGKRLRGMIPVWLHAARGVDAERAIPLGGALELVHNATLVHDDLQDGDTLRRGRATVWKRWSPAQAINCGDAFYQLAIELACELEAEPEVVAKVVRRLAQGTLQVIEGQAQEFLMKEEAMPGLERYLGVIRGKTAALIATAFVTSLIALRADARQLELAEDAAMTAGVLFQIQDDLVDLYGDKQRARRGNDIAEGKISALIALLFEAARPADRERADAILRQPRERTSDSEIQEVLGLLERYRIRSALMERIAGFRSRIECHPLKSADPGTHGVLLALTERFLEPLRGMAPTGV